MKRNIICMTLVVMSLVLAACGNSSANSTTKGMGAATASAGNAESSQGTLSPTARNILGIFKLEGTDLAVDATQAATLLPLWQAYRSLLKSGTAAPAELEAVQTQIGEALTAKQQDAIAAMNLTPRDIFDMAQQLGIAQATPSTNGTGSGSTRPFVFSGGGPGGAAGEGAPPSGGGSNRSSGGGGGGFVFRGEGGMPGGEAGGFDPSMLRGTPQAGQASASRQRDRFSLALLDPLIELLKQRAAS